MSKVFIPLINNAIDKDIKTIGPLIRNRLAAVAAVSVLVGAAVVYYDRASPVVAALAVGGVVYVVASDQRIDTAIKEAVASAF